MQFVIVNLSTKKKQKLVAANLAAAASMFMEEPVIFMGAFISCDNCYRGNAVNGEGKTLGRLEIVRTA